MAAYDSLRFPKATAPALPVPSAASYAWCKAPAPRGTLGLRQTIRTYSGRYALYLALKHAGLRPGDRVLLPAYHCLAMVEPLRVAGLEPIYYPLRADLSIEPEVIARLARSGAKAVLAVHYFGFVQDLTALRRLADRLGLVLVEDCAHTCFGACGDAPVGGLGDYAIASTQKFFPIPDGGLLTSARRDLSAIRLARPPLRLELKAAVNLLERALAYGRLGPAGRALAVLIGIKDLGLRTLARGRSVGRAGAIAAGSPPASTPEYAMDPRWLAWRGTRVGTFLLRRARTDGLARCRRDYYLKYLQAVAGRSDCRPLFDGLPAGVVPQVFPIYVDACLEVFVALKREGVPIIRFGEFLDAPVTRDLCRVSVDFADHVLQFPCHQELLESEVEWIVGRLRAALDSARPGARLAVPTAPPVPARDAARHDPRPGGFVDRSWEPRMMVWEPMPVADFAHLAESWDTLNRAGSGSALLESRFVALLLRYFGTPGVRLAVGTRSGSVAAMALVQRTAPGTWITFQPDQAPLGMWLCAPDVDRGAAARALLKRLPGAPLLLGLMQQDPDIHARPADAPALRTLDYIRTARIPTLGSFDDYWSARGKNLRHNLKRQRNRLEREGVAPRLEVATAPGEMAGVVADYGRLEAAGWKTATGTAVTPDNLQGTFYRDLLETFAATGDAFGYRFYYNDRVVACDLCIRGNGILNWLKTTYDESETTSSPAGLLRQDAFRLAFADPASRVIEFYGPLKDWHTKWSDESRTIYHANVYRWPWLARLHGHLRRPSADQCEPPPGGVARSPTGEPG